MKHLFVRWIAVLLGVLMCALPVWGEEADPSETASQVLETMVVTSGRVKEKKEDLTTNITIFTEEDIQQSSVQDLSDLLAKEGFMILEYPNSTISVAIRGLRTDTHGEHGFSSRLNFSYIGEQDITDYEGTGATTLDKYTVADLMISKRLFSFEKYGTVSLKAEITNLFDESYAAVQGYTMPGRTFYAGLKYNF